MRAKTKQSKGEKKEKKVIKVEKLQIWKSKKMIYKSENNSYKTNLIEIPLHRNSSSIDSFTIVIIMIMISKYLKLIIIKMIIQFQMKV